MLFFFNFHQSIYVFFPHSSVISTVCYNTKHKDEIQTNGENDNNNQN